MLVAPSAQEGSSTGDHAHLASFLRSVSEEDIRSFSRAVGQAMLKRVADVGDAPIFLSTSGLGVSWLHMRLDSRPKYYTFEPYKA